MSNDETFGALDFQPHNTISDAENELLQCLLTISSNPPANDFLQDTQKLDTDSQNDSRAIHHIVPNDVP
jgi:hypothetical protein